MAGLRWGLVMGPPEPVSTSLTRPSPHCDPQGLNAQDPQILQQTSLIWGWEADPLGDEGVTPGMVGS